MVTNGRSVLPRCHVVFERDYRETVAFLLYRWQVEQAHLLLKDSVSYEKRVRATSAELSLGWSSHSS